MMTILWLLAIGLVRSSVYSQGQTIKYISACSVQLCNTAPSSSGGVGNNCSSMPTCYKLQTSTNVSICAPQVACDLFDPCINGTRCAANLTRCIINSCCPIPVCLPISLIAVCDPPLGTNAGSSPQGRLCPNATWNPNYTNLFNDTSYYYYNTIADYFINKNGSIYIANSSAKSIVKYTLGSLSITAVMGGGNSSIHTIQRISVDTNGSVYSSEYRTNYSSPFYVTVSYYRIKKYDASNPILGTTLFGESTCGPPPYQYCGCSDLFVDQRNSIYCSDSINHIVINITPNNMSATVIAGITNTSGSQLNQLNNPQGIFIDANGTLFVADAGNNRVMMFLTGNRYGVHLFTPSSSSGMYGSYNLYGLTVDSIGSVYVAGSNVNRWAQGTTYFTTLLNSSSWYYYYYSYYSSQRIAFDNFGNLYLRTSSGSGIVKYDIGTNTC